MPLQQDFTAYHKSIADELGAMQNRVRNLIGNAHWLTDGEHKEAVLRNVLRSRLPESVRIGKGFVCFPSEARDSEKYSGQLDILITSKDKPTLYKDGELVFVTADAVEAVIEVKTTWRPADLTSFADEVEFIRRNALHKRCWAGLFVYDRGNIEQRNVLRTLQRATQHAQERAIDCVAIGQDTFVHFWSKGRHEVGSPVSGPVWHSYRIVGLAPAYFVSNVALYLCPQTPEDAQRAWFPIEGGKESKRCFYAAMDGDTVEEFE